MSHHSVVSSFFKEQWNQSHYLCYRFFVCFISPNLFTKLYSTITIWHLLSWRGSKKKSAKFQSRLDQIRFLVQYSLLRNKPIFSIVFLKYASLHFLTQYCEFQCKDCWPRSTADLALGKGAPVKLLKLNIKTNKQNKTWFVWLRTIRV